MLVLSEKDQNFKLSEGGRYLHVRIQKRINKRSASNVMLSSSTLRDDDECNHDDNGRRGLIK